MSNLNKDIQEYVKSKCATYAGNGRCLLDRPCPFFSDDDSARCLYFENGVLPEDDKLEARYWARFGLTHWNESSYAKPCKRCGNVFDSSDSPKRQYCDNCKDEQAREKRNQRNRKYRRNMQDRK